MTILDKEEYSSTNKKQNKVNKQKNKSIKEAKKKKQPIVRYKILSFLMIVFTVIMFCLVIYNEFFSILSIITLILVVAIVVFIITFLLVKTKLRTWVKNIISLGALGIIIVDLLMIFFGTSTLKFLSSITDTGYRVETYGVYVLKDSDYEDIKDLDDKKVNYLDTLENDNVLKAIGKIKKDIKLEVEGIAGIDNLLDLLIGKEIDAIIIEVSYEELIKEEYEEEYKKIECIETIDIVDNVSTIKSEVNLVEEPFVMYISGIDTTGNIASKARSDVNILLVVNPVTRNILMVNTPRDYYVKLHTSGKYDKLTHSGLYGIEESIYTLEDLYGINIDYYVRANFTSVLKMIDILDGIEVDVPIEFCEQDSNRSFDKKDLICLKKGVQTLNGEEALALARHRKTLATGDRARGNNQMLVLQAMINKTLSPKIITNYSGMINALQGRVLTNVTTDEMYLGAKMLAKNTDGWKFLTLNAKGSDGMEACYSVGNSYSSVLIADEEYIASISETINTVVSGQKKMEFEERKSLKTSY